MIHNHAEHLIATVLSNSLPITNNYHYHYAVHICWILIKFIAKINNHSL